MRDREKRIIDMKSGEVRYTVYWAVSKLDNEGNFAIRGDYSALGSPHGTAHMKIERVGDRVMVFVNDLEDYEVWDRIGKVLYAWYPLPVELRYEIR